MSLTNRKYINILFDIFGYSFVGVLAFIFGLVLQNYNSKDAFWGMIWSYSGIVRRVMLVIIIQTLLIFLFGHAYAKSILFGKETVDEKDGMDACGTVGHWLETIIAIVAVILVILQILWPTLLDLYFWVTVMLNSASYVSSFFAYRRLRVRKVENDGEKKKLEDLRSSSRYVLFCPAAIMIGFNIMSGANLCAMLEGNTLCYVFSSIFVIALQPIYYANRKYLKYVSVCLLFAVVGVGLASVFMTIEEHNSIVLKNCFLACMVSVFLSIFESWYVVFRQKERNPDVFYFRLTLGVVAVAPAVVALLFPIQNFNFVYFISFWIGMGITDYISFLVIFPLLNEAPSKKSRKKRFIAFARAFCGIATLILLILDKYITKIPVWYDTGAQLISDDSVSVLSFVVSVIGFVVPFINNRKGQSGNSTFFRDSTGNWTVVGYMSLRFLFFGGAIIVSNLLYGFANGEVVKARLSSCGILVYLFFSLWLCWKSSKIRVKDKETQR